MISHLYLHTGQIMSASTMPVDDPWSYNIHVQIFCRNQEEHDYLSALNLVHGRQIEINIWDEWLAIRQEMLTSITRPRVYPIAYTTWAINLEGM